MKLDRTLFVPGTLLVLHRDVENPGADRRRNDWLAQPVWPRGTTFRAEADHMAAGLLDRLRGEHADVASDLPPPVILARIGGRERIYASTDQGGALLPHLGPTTENLGSVLSRLPDGRNDADLVLALLLERGALGTYAVAEVGAAVARLNQMDEAEWDRLLRDHLSGRRELPDTPAPFIPDTLPTP
jgi:hypothetical protein